MVARFVIAPFEHIKTSIPKKIADAFRLAMLARGVPDFDRHGAIDGRKYRMWPERKLHWKALKAGKHIIHVAWCGKKWGGEFDLKAGGKMELRAFSGAKPKKAFALDMGKGIIMKFVWIPPGTFTKEDADKVTIEKGFWMGQYEVTVDQFRRVMETNYFGAVRCVKRALPAMRKRGAGCIINITSIAGRVAFWASSAYSASKFALEAFTESLAQEVNGLGIRVALVEPGIIDTAMATTSLPQYDNDTIYPQGHRLHAFFNNPDKPQASPALVSEMIRYVIESEDPRLRFPVGPDALPFLGWRASLSDEQWVHLNSIEDDADYFQQVFRETGIDLRSP